MDRNDIDREEAMADPEPPSYALSGKIMLTAIVVLLFIIVLMIILHFYARWYLLRARRRNIRRRHRRTHLVFYVEPINSTAAAAHSQGLDPNVLKSLPLFLYSPGSESDVIPECAVCLSEFEENETGRLLPKCKHRFHTECIDMWFHSHSTCPLCRSPVEAPEKPADVVVDVGDSGLGSGSEACAGCRQEESSSSSSSSSSTVAGRRKLEGVSVQIPGRGFDLTGGELSESPASQGAFRSPMSRMLSFTRMLSRDSRRGGGGGGEGGGDLENGRRETPTAAASQEVTNSG